MKPRAASGDRIVGPLTHIFRYDTPVDGYDSEVGFPVNEGEIRTHTLRSMHFFANVHEGSVSTLPQTRAHLYEHMNRVGLSPELELVEVFHRYDPDEPENQRVESMASYLPWPEKYREELVRVLGGEKAEIIWEDGETMTPHTPVDERCRWVAASIERLKEHSTLEEQFDVLSRVALVRPPDDMAKTKGSTTTQGGTSTRFSKPTRPTSWPPGEPGGGSVCPGSTERPFTSARSRTMKRHTWPRVGHGSSSSPSWVWNSSGARSPTPS